MLATDASVRCEGQGMTRWLGGLLCSGYHALCGEGRPEDIGPALWLSRRVLRSDCRTCTDESQSCIERDRAKEREGEASQSE